MQIVFLATQQTILDITGLMLFSLMPQGESAGVLAQIYFLLIV
jgi:hypothetical protein